MPAPPSLGRLPTATAVAGLVLAFYYALVLKPLAHRAANLDAPLTNVWARLALTNRAYDAWVGLDASNVVRRLEELRNTATNLQTAQRLVQTRLALPGDVTAHLGEPFQLIDFQNDRIRGAEALVRLAKEKGIAVEPPATNGLPEYSVDLLDPRLLWPRLHLAHQILLTAVNCKVAGILSLKQLPSVSHRSAAPGLGQLEELPMRIELFGSADAIAQFMTSLPLRGPELDTVGLAGALTNKPVFFIDQVLARKHSPERPGDVLLDLSVSGYAPVGPEGVEPAGSPGG